MLDEAIRDAVGVLGEGLEFAGVTEEVSVELPGGKDSLGTPLPFGAPSFYPALVQRKRGSIPTSGGTEIGYDAIISFLAPVNAPNGSRVAMADGTRGIVFLPTGGLSDPSTAKPYVTIVYIR